MKIVLTPDEWKAIEVCKDFLVKNPSPCMGCGHLDCEACCKKFDWDREYKKYSVKVPDETRVYDYMQAMVKTDTLVAKIDKLKEELCIALKDVEQKRSLFVIEDSYEGEDYF